MTETRQLVMRSKIKTLFNEELLKLIGSICDTKRIDSSQRKMKLLQQLLKRYEVRFDVLGGATNRLALFIDGYAVKFAMDRQGYKDNLMEFSLSKELQPYVTKTYETNGYVLIAEAVKTMTVEDFTIRKSDIIKVLQILSTDYLLGDVGYIKKNFTNWGLRDDGNVVILDFAYIHRGTENLFTCDVCGSGILTYDSTYSYLRCSNGTVCTAKYSYHERKVIQGDQVDIDMIDEAKESAIVVHPGEITKTVNSVDGTLSDSDKPIFGSVEDYMKYVKEVRLMLGSDFSQTEAADLIIERFRATRPEEVELLDKKLTAMVGTLPPPDPEFVDMRDDAVESAVVNTVAGLTSTQEDVDEPVVVEGAPTVDDIIHDIRGDRSEPDVVEPEVVNGETEETTSVETAVKEDPSIHPTTEQQLPTSTVTRPIDLSQQEPVTEYIDPLDKLLEQVRKARRDGMANNYGPFGGHIYVEQNVFPTSTVITRRAK